MTSVIYDPGTEIFFFCKSFIGTIVNLNKVNIKIKVYPCKFHNFDHCNYGDYGRECLCFQDVYTEAFRDKGALRG